MPINLNGITPPSLPSSSGESNSTLNQFDLAILTSLVQDLTKEVTKANKFTNNTEKDRQALQKQIRVLTQRSEELNALQETANRLQKYSDQLSETQREELKQEFQNELKNQFDAISEYRNELNSISLVMNNGKLKIGEQFNTTIAKMDSYFSASLKKQEEREYEESQWREYQRMAEESNEKHQEALSEYNERILQSREDLKKDLRGTFKSFGRAIGENTLNILGPFSAPLKLLYNKVLDNKDAFKRPLPNESYLKSRGGDIGAAAVWSTNRLLKGLGDIDIDTSPDKEGIKGVISSALSGAGLSGLEGIVSGLSTGIGIKLSGLTGGLSGLSTRIGAKISGIGGSIASALEGMTLSTALFTIGEGLAFVLAAESVIAIGTGVWEGLLTDKYKDDFRELISSTQTVTIEQVDKNDNKVVESTETESVAKEKLNEAGYSNNLFLNPRKFGHTLGYSYGTTKEFWGYDENDPWYEKAGKVILSFFTAPFVGKGYSDLKAETQVAINDKLREEGGDEALVTQDNFDKLNLLQYLLKITGDWDRSRALEDNFYNNDSLRGKYITDEEFEKSYLHSRPLGGTYANSSKWQDILDRMSNLNLEDNPNNPEAKELIEQLVSEFPDMVKPVNDAIIYKDNSLYVPHPDDNIYLTKDNITTSATSNTEKPILSDSFEGSLFEILRTIAENLKGNGSSFVNVTSVPDSSFDFSALRI